ncbi:hypothetical protein KOSB73_10064 [Klebsiella grimontii]|uniref:Uncharacterized protein n=1 Tax=Klebsiella grimontii TaxID=2058152 RepID=A0A285AUV5_9ENTR|nr:hypothetical protein KOSB73_10064 [Klebsiella grimontii]
MKFQVSGPGFLTGFYLYTFNCKGTIHKATPDTFPGCPSKELQTAWFPLNTCSVLLLKI